jgi:GWxTD domain-containing protein
MRILNYLPFAASIILLGAGCSSSLPSAQGTYTALYDFESVYLHPEFRLYHHHTDSTTLYYRVKSSELLYARRGEGGQEARVRIDLQVHNEQGALSDSLHFHDNDMRETESAGYLYGTHRFKLPKGSWKLALTFRDLNRGAIQEYLLSAEKSSPLHPQYMLVRKSSHGQPVFSAFLSEGDSVILESDVIFGQSGTEKIWISQFRENAKLPPPPFSQNAPEIPSTADLQRSAFDVTGTSYSFVMPGFPVFISTDTEGKQGLFLSPSSPFFPEIKGIDQLTGPLRYITSKAEFDEFSKASFAKPLVDNFWLECAGSKDRARDLIRTFYTRVEETNRYFSSYTEGWKTDRGMIHLVFGNPAKIRRTNNEETWIYGEEGNPASLSFVFRKNTSALSDNVFILQRDPQYRQVWEQMVTAWRQGRVFSD